MTTVLDLPEWIKRANNFSNDDVEILMGEIWERKHAIFGPFINNPTTEMKSHWREIMESRA